MTWSGGAGIWDFEDVDKLYRPGALPGGDITIIPKNTGNLGTSDDRWGELFLSGNADIDGSVDIAETLAVHSSAVFDTSAVFNESGNDHDLRVEGTSDENLLYVDAGNNRVGIGTDSPAVKLHVQNNAVVGDDCAINIIAGTEGKSTIQFGDSGSANAASLEFDHSNSPGKELILSFDGTKAFGFEGYSASLYIGPPINPAAGFDPSIAFKTTANQRYVISASGTITKFYAPEGTDVVALFEKNTSNATRPVVRIHQMHGDGGQACLHLDQDDTSGPFIRFDGSEAADFSKNISTFQGGGAVVGPKAPSGGGDGWAHWKMVLANIGGTDGWVALYTGVETP